MKRFLVCSFLLATLFSCTLQKRLYRPGFAVFRSSNTKVNRNAFIKLPEHASPSLPKQLEDTRGHHTNTVAILKGGEVVKLRTNRSTVFTLKNTFVLPTANSKRREHSFCTTVLPNKVPKAGFRMFIIGSVFFGGALYCFLNFHELVYITAALLLIAFLFTLVSLISSSAARKDKINNGKGWFAMALITLLLDILEMAAIIIFFIALF